SAEDLRIERLSSFVFVVDPERRIRAPMFRHGCSCSSYPTDSAQPAPTLHSIVTESTSRRILTQISAGEVRGPDQLLIVNATPVAVLPRQHEGRMRLTAGDARGWVCKSVAVVFQQLKVLRRALERVLHRKYL